MERKYIVFKTGKGCLFASMGLIFIFMGLFYLAILNISKWIVVLLVVVSSIVLAWGAFNIDKSKKT